jgi:hypothetical protein
MNIIISILTFFAMIVIIFLGVILWSAWYPKVLCQKTKHDDAKFNICVKIKSHTGPHMAADGHAFGRLQANDPAEE